MWDIDKLPAAFNSTKSIQKSGGDQLLASALGTLGKTNTSKNTLALSPVLVGYGFMLTTL
jgi:hypothetical protein